MRCKPGQMALVIKSTRGNEGKIVTCLKYVGDPQKDMGGGEWARPHDYWLVDRMLNTNDGEKTPYARDSFLLPIDPDATIEGIDETLITAEEI